MSPVEAKFYQPIRRGDKSPNNTRSSRIPLGSPIKKIAAEEDFIENILNSSTNPRNLQGMILAGLMQATDLVSQKLEPSHFENTTSREGEKDILPTDSGISNLVLEATIW